MVSKNNTANPVERLKAFFSTQPQVELAYLFGSTARGTTGPMSDVDVAVRFAPGAAHTLDESLKIRDALCRYLGSDRIDFVNLDQASPVLRFNVIRDGVLLKGDDDVRVPFEVKVMSEYFDTHALRAPHDAALRASASAVRT